jgi:probable rRNA maturation factor
MNLVIRNRQRTRAINTRRLKAIVTALLDELEIREGELGVHLVAAPKMAQVNFQFLHHAGSTDVITFDHADGRGGVTSAGLQGELFVCVDDAVSQAVQFGTRWQSEVVRYVVHGILHLCGHDDLKPDLRRRMKREENRLVRLLAKKFSLAQIAAPSKISR